MNITTKHSTKNNTSSNFLHNIRILVLQLIALVLSLVAGYLIWSYAIIDREKQQLNQLSLTQAKHQQQIIQNYLASLIDSATLYNFNQDLSSGIPSFDSANLDSYRDKLFNNIPHLELVKFFGLNQTRMDQAEDAINFVVMDMINRNERGETVYPEAIKAKKANTWLIAIVRPLYQQLNQQKVENPLEVDKIHARNIIGTLYLAVSVEALEKQLSASDQGLGLTQITQRVADKKFIPFIEVGNAAKYPTQRLKITNTNWQLSYTPSETLYLQARQPRMLVVLIIVAITFMLTALGWFTARRLNRQSGATAKSTNETPDSPITFPSKKQIATTVPIDDVDSLLNIELSEEDKALLDGPISLGDEANASNKASLDRKTEISLDNKINEEHIAVMQERQRKDLPHCIFRAYDIRGIVDKQLTCELAKLIGQALASEVLDKGEKYLFVGRDGRSHSPKIADAFARGVLSTGCNIIDLGLVPTPLVNFAALTSEITSSAAMVTASHNSKEYNGFKFLIKGRTLVDQDMQAIKNSIAKGDFHTGRGSTEYQSINQRYIERIVDDIALPGNLHIVIDAANGATSAIAPQLFEKLSCTVTPLFCEIDGDFPNHDPDPSVVENLQPLIESVKQQRADLGLAFDGDGDRLVVITPKGKIVWPDQLMMLFAEDVASRNPGCDIIYDVKSTRQLSQIIARCGGRPIMWKTGHANMKAKMYDTGALLAGEFSGHIFFKERWFGFDDGMYAAARLLEIVLLGGRDIDDIFEEFQPLVTTPEIKIPVGEEEKFSIIESLIETASFANGKKVTIDGIRVDFPRCWGLIRASNTSAALTLRFEAETEQDMDRIKRLFRLELGRANPKLPKYF